MPWNRSCQCFSNKNFLQVSTWRFTPHGWNTQAKINPSLPANWPAARRWSWSKGCPGLWQLWPSQQWHRVDTTVLSISLYLHKICQSTHIVIKLIFSKWSTHSTLGKMHICVSNHLNASLLLQFRASFSLLREIQMPNSIGYITCVLERFLHMPFGLMGIRKEGDPSGCFQSLFYF